MRPMRRSFKALPVSLLLLASSLLVAIQLAPPVSALSPPSLDGSCSVQLYSASLPCTATGLHAGDMVVIIGWSSQKNVTDAVSNPNIFGYTSSGIRTPPTDSCGDKFQNYDQSVIQSITVPSGPGVSNIITGVGAMFSAIITCSGSVTFTTTTAQGPNRVDSSVEVSAWTGVLSAIPEALASGGPSTSTTIQTSTSPGFTTGQLAISVITSINSGTLYPGTDYSIFGLPIGEYSYTPSSSTTNFPMSCTGCGSITWAEGGAIFGPGLFTCSITNMDGGDYVVAGNGKFYDFVCEIQSNAINPSVNYAISNVEMQFNDSNSVVVTVNYSNSTDQFTILQGGSVATLGTGNVSQSYNPTSGVRSMNVTFPIMLNTNAINVDNRGIELSAEDANAELRGLEYVQRDYFNVITSGNGGGGVESLNYDGDCSIPSGADTFQTICAYGSNAHNWIQENATYYQLQQYQGQFSIATLDQYGEPTPAFWQNYPNSGSGTNPSSNPGDWQINAGFYTWDNSSVTCCWVKTIHVNISMLEGRVGSNNLWTAFQCLWYDGSSLIVNQTVFAFVPTDSPNKTGASSVAIWLNFWYSQNNGSTYLGGEVGAYYTGMHNVGSIFGSNWSPFLGNYSNSQVFVPLDNHLGDVMPAQMAQMTTVYMNMTRPGAPEQHTNQANFEVETTNFQEQEFNVASAGMTGIATPTFASAVVPTVQSNSIFSPIINAIKSIASFVAKAFVALGTIVWNGLAARFPWFTNFWAGVGGAVYQFALQFEQVIIYVLDALQVFAKGLSFLGTIFGTLTSAYGTISSAYTSVFKGQSLQEMILIIVLLVFVGDIMNAAERGDTMHFVHLAQGAWGIAQTVMWWTYLFVKFIIDSIEGLIP